LYAPPPASIRAAGDSRPSGRSFMGSAPRLSAGLFVATAFIATAFIAPVAARAAAPAPAKPGTDTFQPMDVFGLEWASDTQIAPDGKRVAYIRNSMDVMKDRRRSQIW